MLLLCCFDIIIIIIGQIVRLEPDRIRGNFQPVAVKAACDSISLSQSLPRDAMRKRGLCCRPVSVCPSVTLVYCIHVSEDIVKLLPLPGNTIILVFLDSKSRYPTSRRTSAGALNTRGWEKFAIFD